MLQVVIALLVTAFGVAGSVIAALWPRIVGWTRVHLLPWVEQNLSFLAQDVRDAFQALDSVVVGVRNLVRAAWRRVRKVLLSQTAEFLRLVDDEWSLRITSWLHNKEEREKPVTKVVTEQRLGYDELPAEVREQALRHNVSRYSLDVTDVRDQELSDSA